MIMKNPRQNHNTQQKIGEKVVHCTFALLVCIVAKQVTDDLPTS